MIAIEKLCIDCGGIVREVELMQGDLAQLPKDYGADIMVISAFQGDYYPSRSSLIGALHREAGLSVEALANDKQIDLRQQFSSWLSRPLAGFGCRQVLCIESGWKGSPPEITDDVFRALAPILLSEPSMTTVVMPIIGAGDQAFEPDIMLKSILTAAIAWMQRGLPLKSLKIFAYRPRDAQICRDAFLKIKGDHQSGRHQVAARNEHDVFISYCHRDAPAALHFVDVLKQTKKNLRVFIDREGLRHGGSWPLQLAEALDSSRRVVAFYSQHYWDSKNCKMELLAAIARQNETGEEILFPLYLSDASIPYMFRSFHYKDCRVSDREKIKQACEHFASSM